MILRIIGTCFEERNKNSLEELFDAFLLDPTIREDAITHERIMSVLSAR
jgi:hypothetical protein